MMIRPVYTDGIAHSSYLLCGSRRCAVVDPRRDVEVYLRTARALGMDIAFVLTTHLHADFVSGHLELAEAAGAQLVAPRSADAAYEHQAVAEGDTMALDEVTVEVRETPGHTPEHVSYVVRDTARSDEPAAVFTGDTLFVGDVGRPDLFPGKAEELARRLFRSLHGTLLDLPDHCEVYPAHGAGSLCGRSLGARRSSTVGYERRCNPALAEKDEDAFVASLTRDMPSAPDHFARLSEVNRAGPELLATLPEPRPLDPAAFRRLAGEEGRQVADLRAYDAFGGQHVPGAVSLDLEGNFPTFAGWVLPPDADLLLVADDERQVRAAVRSLRRVGLDRAAGLLEGGMPAWAAQGLPCAHLPQLSAGELHERMSQPPPLTLLDVRSRAGFVAFHIEGARHVEAPDLRTALPDLDPDAPAAVLCGMGRTSSLGASLLLRRGFRRLRNVAGGMAGYRAAGFAPACPVCMVPHGPRSG